MAVKKYVPDPQKQINAIRDVVYEYANLIAASDNSLRGSDQWRTNCNDAFLLGCRKLGDFLMNDKRSIKGGKELDDILAIDYLPPNATRDWELPIWTAEWRKPMNIYLAHISYSRTDDPVKHWDHTVEVPRLEAEFKKAWWKFRDAITDKKYSEKFDKEIAFCQGKLGFENIDLQRH